MKLFIAGLATETNSFSPIPTGTLAFEDAYVGKNATQEPPNLFSAPMHEWRHMAEAEGWSVTEGLCAFAQPAGPTIRSTYESFRDDILADLKAAKPDIVLLTMHGAMIAEGYDDCEGDLLTHVRDIVGPDVTVGLEIDPHNHLTDAMLSAANLIVSYKEYPHTDGPDRARELFTLAADTAAGKINPVMRDYDCRMIAMFHTSRSPMREFVDDMMAREGSEGILSLSLSHGFPWGDCARVGARMLAITDGDADKASAVAQEFGKRLWDNRESFRPDWPSISEALDKVQTGTDKPLVLADFADNAGGGAPADSTFVLQQVLDRGMRNVALGIFWDPVLVRMCQDVGVGGTMRVRLGGKVDVCSGDPVDLTVTIRGIKTGMHQMMGATAMPMGTGVWLEADGVHMVLSDKRTQAFHPDAFKELGLDLGSLDAVIVKSSQHFYAGFAPIASDVIYINGPGAITPDYANIPYTKRDGNFWPKVENPF
ncbi:MlrC domain protein [Sulfitobacter noctilucicola]|uniref:Microcystinase C n=1 Tax=Sulfitobacter noctilucicola TaxID=1342301 RepID=A0A7W6M5W9_9RHOB|nr:M81 family metallopeptidase [Sulfitobacter noctilucicola]KIN62730.1 MlrC domain protein [Sulfitobacter noctilucicola]MBB4172737.1 microcystin degradation protein MlrC [Sulfitobacter noctilucicola]